MAKSRLNWGERVGRKWNPVREALTDEGESIPFELSDLPSSVTPEYFVQRMREIEYDVEYKIRARMRAQGREEEYLQKFDPFKMHLGELEPYESERILAEISNLTGAEHFLNILNRGPTMIRDYEEAGRDTRSPAGVFQMTPEAIARDPRAAYLSQTTFRFAKMRATESAAENYLPAQTLPRIESILQNQDRLAKKLSGKGKTLVFDVETPGLNPDEGIWQLAAQLVDEEGNIEPVQSFYFDNHFLKKGLIQNESGQAERLDRFLLRGQQTDFETNMRQFFAMASQAENIAGHNILFDYNRVAKVLRESDPYKHKADFQTEAEQFLARFERSDAVRSGKVIDTSVLARMVLPHIKLANELKGGANPYRFSLQNLLLQTNLSEYFTPAELAEMINSLNGLHYAHIDVPFETKLLRALRMHLSGELRIELGNQFLTGNLRRQVARSAPIGPNIEMVNEGFYHGSFLGVGGPFNTELGGSGPLSPMEQMSIQSRHMELRSKVLPGSTDADVVSRITSQDRLIGSLSKRKLISQDYKYLNLAADIPDPQEWYKIQKELAAEGVPLPGLFLFERHVASLMSSIAGPGMNAGEATMRELAGADMLGLGRFIEADAPKVVGRTTKIVVLPLQYLKEWEKELRDAGHEHLATNFLQGNQMLGMSAFRWKPHNTPDAPRIKEVGLNVQLSQEQRESLAHHLSGRDEFQTEEGDTLLTKIVRAFEGGSGTYGVQIGTLGGVKGQDKSASRLYDLIKYYQGIGADTSDQTPMFQTAFAAMGDMVGSAANIIYTAGAFLRGDLMKDQERKSLTNEIAQMITGYQSTISQGRSRATMQMFRGVWKDQRSHAEAISGFQRTRQIVKAAPYAALATIAAAGGYYAYKRHEQNKQIDTTYAQMPSEPPGWSKRNFYQSVPYNPKRDPNSYLDTANVVSGLDNQKINHTNMNQQTKYSYLFAGPNYNT